MVVAPFKIRRYHGRNARFRPLLLVDTQEFEMWQKKYKNILPDRSGICKGEFGRANAAAPKQKARLRVLFVLEVQFSFECSRISSRC